MDYATYYENELNKLLSDENEVLFFTKELMNLYTDNYNGYKELVDFLLRYTSEKGLLLANAVFQSYKSWCYYNENRYDDAINMSLEAYSILEKSDFKIGMVRACNSIMNFYAQIGKAELSNDWGIRAVLIAEEMGDEKMVFTMLLNISISYIELELFDKAKEILDYLSSKGFQMTTAIKITYLQNASEVEINIGDANLALKLLSDIFEIGQSENIDFYLPESIKLKAMAYCKLKEYDKSQELFSQSIDLCKKEDNTFQQCLCLYNRSKLYIEMNKYDVAYDEMKSVIDISKKYKFMVLLLSSYKLMYNICKTTGNISEALYYLEEYIAAYKEINERKINNWETDINVGRMEREAKLYKILYDKTELLSSIGRDILSSLDENTILTIITREIQKLMKARLFSIALYDKDKNEITYKYVDDKTVKIKGPCKIGNNDSLSDYCISYGKDIIIRDFTKEYKQYNIKSIDELYNQSNIYKSILFTPMYANEKIIGIITVQDTEVNSFNKNDLNTLKILSNYVSTALYNASLYKDMENKAVYDELTGIYNRSAILGLGEKEYKTAQLENKPLVIAMLDIDKLKKINDNYGHVAGDTVLRNVSLKMQATIRKADYCGKYGGDEFLLVFRNTHIKEAKLIAERIRNSIEGDTLIINGKKIHFSISIGLYEIKRDDDTFMSCVNKADIALYEAKKLYGNKVIKFTGLA